MATEQMESPRLLTPEELAVVVKMLREVRQWSQETLASLSGVNVRTVQRVERGQPSDLDTRRALARAFGCSDIDAFNKPHDIPTPEKLKAEKEKFDREHITIDAQLVTSGRELARMYSDVAADIAQPAIALERDAEEPFAALTDYLRDWRDMADEYSEVAKLGVYDELQRYLDSLESAGVSVCFAKRKVTLTSKQVVDQIPLPMTLGYLVAFPKGKCPEKIAVARQVQF